MQDQAPGQGDRPHGWRRNAVAVTPAFLYALFLFAFYRTLGTAALVFALLPVWAAAWAWGWRGGIAMGVAATLAHAAIRAWIGPGALRAVLPLNFFASHATLIAFGGIVGNLYDLRRRLRAELARTQRAEQRYRAIFEGAADPMIIYDLSGRVLDVNRAACEQLDYARDDLLALKPWEITPSADPESIPPLLRELNERQVLRAEMTQRRRDGSLIPVEIHARAIDYGGQPAVLSIARDISERKRNEEALRASQEMLQLIMNHIPMAIFWKDRRGVFLGCNHEFAQDAGLPGPEAVVGKDDFAMPWADLAEVYRADDVAVIESGEPRLNYEEPQITPQGEHIWLRTSKVPLRNAAGEVVAVLGMYEDITRTRDAQRAVVERERFLALLNEITQAALLTTDLDEILQTLADNLGALFEADACYITLWDETTQTAVPRAAYGEWRETYAKIKLEPGEPTVTSAVLRAGYPLILDDLHDTPLVSKRIREMFPDRAMLALPLVADGRKLGAALVAFNAPRGVTPDDVQRGHQVAAQMALAIAKAQLVDTLRAHIQELEARNQELDAFAHTVAHDLKAPLGIVLGYAGLLLEMRGTLADEEVQASLDTIARQGERMARIVDELLLLASLRQTDLHMHLVDMQTIVQEVELRLAHMIRQRQAELVLPPSWHDALGYGPWIEEVWANYISNAIKYGGAPPRVELGSTQVANGTVRFWVRDNGLGVTAEEQARLFMPFTKLGQVRATGHGLGLSIVARIIDRLGGAVGVESTPGKGSEFWFTLPRA